MKYLHFGILKAGEMALSALFTGASKWVWLESGQTDGFKRLMGLLKGFR